MAYRTHTIMNALHRKGTESKLTQLYIIYLHVSYLS